MAGNQRVLHLAFQKRTDIACAMEHPNDLHGIVDKAVKDEIVLESGHRPSPKPLKSSIAVVARGGRPQGSCRRNRRLP